MKAVAFISPDVCLEHDTGPGHPEQTARLASIRKHLEQSGLLEDLETLEARSGSNEEISMAHPADHVARIVNLLEGGVHALDPDTTVSDRTLEAARYAAGSALTGIDLMENGRFERVFCGVRPPGHHAESRRAMGFCIFNNVAVAAHAALARGLAERVLIIDWDVHHGNGTQEVFWTSDKVFYYSSHQYPFYPGTGAASERGIGPGEGTTLNRPLPAGTGDHDFLKAFEGDLEEIGKRFSPDLVIVSAGFDAHERDPLGAMRITTQGYAEMSRMVAAFANDHAEGRVLSVLEGGYDLDALAASVATHLRVLRET